MNYDVIVAGAGCAGVFAAISAGRLSSKVLLIEKNAMPGGTATSARVNFPGLFFAWGKQIISGPCFEAILRTLEKTGGKLPQISFKPEHHWLEQINIDIFAYVHTLDEMLNEAGVDVLYHSMLSEISEDDEGVKIKAVTKGGVREFTAKAFIDCTGDADYIALAGYEREGSCELQPATLINDVGGYDFEDIDVSDLNEKLDAALKSGLLSGKDTQGGSLYNQLRAHRISMHLDFFSPDDPFMRSKIEAEARQTLFRIVSFLKTVKGLENLRVTSFANECGIRESFRIKGKSTVSTEDYINAVPYDDGICYAFYPIDLHVSEGIKQVFLEENTVPQVPMGALIPQKSRFLLSAGRTVSSSRDANSALRVQAVASATGQAAGVMAHLMAKSNTCSDDLDICTVKNLLKELGAIVP